MVKELIDKCISANRDLNLYFTNKSIPLEQRWSDFQKIPETLKKVSNGLNLRIDTNLLEDMGLKKGDVLSFSIFLENMEIMKAEVDDGAERAQEYSSRSWLKKIKVDDFYEDVLSKGFHSFVHNW